jgi:DNA-binding PadR family transcriptional regulator
MYEFLILGILMDGPCHGYGIRRIVERIFGTRRTVAWGTLYATLHKLQEAGLIDLAAPASGEAESRTGPPSKWYRITDAGCRRFYECMRIPDEPYWDEDLAFIIQITRFGHVDQGQRLALLGHRLDVCRQQLADLSLWWRQVSRAQMLPDHERPWILMSIDHRRALVEAEIAWVSEQLAALEQGNGAEIRMAAPCEAPVRSMLTEEIIPTERERNDR